MRTSRRRTRCGADGAKDTIDPYRTCDLQSIFSPSALTTGAQRATSAARDWRNFSGFESRVGFDTRLDQQLLVGRLCERRARRLRNLFDDRRSVFRPARAVQSSLSRSGRGGPVRPPSELRRSDETLRARHRENAYFAGAMEFEHLPGHAGRPHGDLSADHVSDRRPRAPIGHLHDLRRSGEQFEQFAGQMLDRSRHRRARRTACRDWLSHKR